jgi:apolipoprotein N-acyltransferase
MYVKRHPVPFGEYLPFRSFFTSFVGRFASLMPDDFVPGSKPGVLPIATPAGTVTVGDVICFEVAYDSIVRDVVGNGDTSGGLLIVQTNNATFGRSAESRQQLAMVQLRAVEHDRSAVMASTTGVSAIVRADGSIAASTPLFTPAALVQRVPLSTARTLADRLGEVPEWTVVAVAAAGVAVGAVRRRAS